MTFDKLYTDFTEKVLPLAAQGLQITKEYFTDLAGRYVQYLVISDSIKLAFALLLIVASIAIGTKLIKQGIKVSKSDVYDQSTWAPAYIVPGIVIIFVGTLVGIINSVIKSDDLIKTLTVPEIRIYQELKPFMK